MKKERSVYNTMQNRKILHKIKKSAGKADFEYFNFHY